MPAIKEYKIPFLGESGNFSIIYYENRIGEVESGYYGIQGVSAITKGCKTAEEAENALVNKVLEIITTQHKVHLQQATKLFDSLDEISSSRGLSKYLVA